MGKDAQINMSFLKGYVLHSQISPSPSCEVPQESMKQPTWALLVLHRQSRQRSIT